MQACVAQRRCIKASAASVRSTALVLHGAPGVLCWHAPWAAAPPTTSMFGAAASHTLYLHLVQQLASASAVGLNMTNKARAVCAQSVLCCRCLQAWLCWSTCGTSRRGHLTGLTC